MHRSPLAVLLGSLVLIGGAVAQVTNTPPLPTPLPLAAATNSVAGSGPGANTNIVGVIDAETRELKPNDIFRYRIEQDPVGGSEPLRVTITASGEAHFNVSRGHSTYVTVKAAGRHLADIRKDFKEKLDEKFYRDATVTLDLEGVNSTPGGGPAALGLQPRVTVFGEMQGSIPIIEGQRLMLSDVILMLGKNDFANLKKIKVQRINSTGQPEVIIVNIDKVLKENDRNADFELKDGDRINVPRKIFPIN